MPGSEGLRICVFFWKKAVNWDSKLDEGVDFWTWVRPVQLGLRDATRVVKSGGTVSIVKIVSLSPRVENLTVKKFRTWTKESRQCFSRIAMFYWSVNFYVTTYSGYAIIWLRKINLNREAESLLISAQNNAIRTNYIWVEIDNTKANRKCTICGFIWFYGISTITSY